jgi:hypothetical protein
MNKLLTQVLNILISSEGQRATRSSSSSSCAGAESLVDNNAVGHGSGDESGAIRELRPARVVVEGNVGQGVSKDTEEQGEVSENAVLVFSTTACSL